MRRDWPYGRAGENWNGWRLSNSKSEGRMQCRWWKDSYAFLGCQPRPSLQHGLWLGEFSSRFVQTQTCPPATTRLRMDDLCPFGRETHPLVPKGPSCPRATIAIVHMEFFSPVWTKFVRISESSSLRTWKPIISSQRDPSCLSSLALFCNIDVRIGREFFWRKKKISECPSLRTWKPHG